MESNADYVKENARSVDDERLQRDTKWYNVSLEGMLGLMIKSLSCFITPNKF